MLGGRGWNSRDFQWLLVKYARRAFAVVGEILRIRGIFLVTPPISGFEAYPQV
jgi:hypothetical protein